jgi:hypothetical protein
MSTGADSAGISRRLGLVRQELEMVLDGLAWRRVISRFGS